MPKPLRENCAVAGRRHAGPSLRTQTQLQNAHCEEPALSCTSAEGGLGEGLRSCLVRKRYAQDMVATAFELSVDNRATF